MKFWEAMKALDEGKRITLPVWADQDYYISTQGGRLHDSNGNSVGPYENWLFMDWELYQEPSHDWTWAKEQLRAGNRVAQRYSIKTSWYLDYDRSDDIVWVRYYDNREAPTEKWVSFEDEDATNWILG